MNELIVHVGVGGGTAEMVTVLSALIVPVVQGWPFVGLLPANVVQPVYGVPA